MGFADSSGVRLYWRLEGAEERPVILLLHPLGSDLNIWDRTVPLLSQRLRVLRMDMRGHGASGGCAGDQSLQTLTQDALAVLEAARVTRAAVCGLSIGGMIALSLALTAPARLEALICACTSAKMDRQLWVERIATIRREGIAPLAPAALQRYLTPEYALSHPEIVGTLRTALLGTDAEAYAGCAAAIRDMDLVQELAAIDLPTLVIFGQHDTSTPLQGHAQVLLGRIPGARGCELPTAHFACLEAPEAFAAAVCDFVMGVRAAWESRR
jgi:3-oxoadipate enol-lactonase/4-carboxymuconolactone decarboxylase